MLPLVLCPYPILRFASYISLSQVVELLSLLLDEHERIHLILPRFAQLLRDTHTNTGTVGTVESRSSGDMSTAVAETRPAYGFPPGSGKKSGGDREALPAGKRRSDGFFIEEEDEDEEEVLTENSSIGAPSLSSSSIGENSSSEAGGDEGEEEVESKLNEGDGLGCLDALEDSLPIKSGLSSFYSGKSKSFTSLAEATSTVAEAKELAKPENPFNKRRRILANWSRRASCSSLATATYLPSLLAPDHAVAEGNEGEEDDSDDDYEYSHLPHRGKNGSNAPALPLPPPRLGTHPQMGLARRNGHGTFRSPRSFSLSDLQNSGDNNSS